MRKTPIAIAFLLLGLLVLARAAAAQLDGPTRSDGTTWTMPNCIPATQKIHWNTVTKSWECQLDVTGLGGSANVVSLEVDFGAAGATTAAVTVTGQTWVTASSMIVCAPTAFATADRADGAEDAAIEGLVATPYARVAATGFSVQVGARIGRALGRYLIHCTGV